MKDLKVLFSIGLYYLFALIANAEISFIADTFNSTNLTNPTSLDIGPDGKLYVAQQNGLIHQHVIARDEDGDYYASSKNTINLIQNIPNHNDDGNLNLNIKTRQITGILALGTASNPVLYVTSSDPRIGGGGQKGDVDLDTNSGILSRLTWNGSAWIKLDLIRGLPRSEENHSVNGMQYDAVNNNLFLAVGGMTNAGSPSNNFAFITEYALSAAIICIQLNDLDEMPVLGTAPNQYVYDLPTLDDPYRTGTEDANDPFGGNDGLNQAMLDLSGPIQIYSPGYRNAFDIVLTESRRLYTWDNGANQGWGGHPDNEGAIEVNGVLTTNVTNNYVAGEPGSDGPSPNDAIVNNKDGLHFIGAIDSYKAGDYYGGHPNPVRANPSGAGLYTHDGTSGTFRTTQTGDTQTTLPSNWPPIPLANANPIEGDFQNPGVDNSSLYTLESSTNGMAEYTASNFNGELQGDLLAVSYDGAVYRVDIDNTTGAINGSSDVTVLASGFGMIPLDVTTQSDFEIYPGTIWVVSYLSNKVTVFEPVDFFECDGTDDPEIDEDGDGYMNADEIAAGTSPCNGASFPADADGDFISDFNDTDDDNDGIPDTNDYFPLDSKNGLDTHIPINYELLNGDPGFGFFGLGFTGLMHDNVNDYANLLADESNSSTELIAGGAVGLLTINNVSTGDALGSFNDQKNGFQFGLNVMASTPTFTVSARALGPFFVNTPGGASSMGIFIGDGSQDEYIKIVIDANSGTPGISVVSEIAGIANSNFYTTPDVASASEAFLHFEVDPANGTVQPSYTVGTATSINLGSTLNASGALLNALQGTPALAVGVIATSREANNTFNATWEELLVNYNDTACNGTWKELSLNSSDFDERHEATYVAVKNKLYLVGGRGERDLNIYDPATDTWTTGATAPVQFHHFQAVELNNELWVAGAFIGNYPNETPLNTIYIYNPDDNLWRTGATIPRPRGSCGVAVYDGKIYLSGGLTEGHKGGHVRWLDRYDPDTDTWTQLADAPHDRDHFQMQAIGDKLWLASGRRTEEASPAGVFGNLVDPVDYYNIGTNTWTTLASESNIPTPRGGAASAVIGNELIVAGGESLAQLAAHNEVEALDTRSLTWRALPNLIQGRHGSGLAELDHRLYIASGSGNRGGGPELDQHEVYLPCSIYEPEISIDASQLDFQSRPKVTSLSQSITLTNTGLSPLTIGSAITTENEFQIETAPATTLQPEQQTTISLNFTPELGTLANIVGELKIYSNAVNQPILKVSLQGAVELIKPTITITTPDNETNYMAGETIHLSGTAQDSEGVELTDIIAWSSDIDGTLGTGKALSLSHLSVGTHIITAKTTSAENVSGESMIELSVLENVFIAINAGGSAYTSTTGVSYIADNYFTPTPGQTFSTADPIIGTQDDFLYQTERWNKSDNKFEYNIPLSPGNYRLILLFAENYLFDFEQRIFDVEIEGIKVIDHLDLYFEAGGHDIAIDKQIDFTLTDNNLDIDFLRNLENPKVNALRVIEPYPNPYPTVVISPENNQSFPTGHQIKFCATGEGTAIWTSDTDGLIGTGTSLDFAGLSEGNHAITLAMTSPSNDLRRVTFNLDIFDPYIYWRDEINWGAEDDTTKTGDPDMDFIDNNLERAMGLNPLVPDRNKLPFSTIEAIESIDYFTFTYRRNLDASDLDFFIDSSITLLFESWSTEILTQNNHEILEEDGSTQVLRFKYLISNDNQRFFRLRIE